MLLVISLLPPLPYLLLHRVGSKNSVPLSLTLSGEICAVGNSLVSHTILSNRNSRRLHSRRTLPSYSFKLEIYYKGAYVLFPCCTWDRNRQLTGPCGKSFSGSKYWTTTYDSSSSDSRPSKHGKVELELLVCCPFGQYELELDVKSYSDKNGKPEKRIAWRIENGNDGVGGK